MGDHYMAIHGLLLHYFYTMLCASAAVLASVLPSAGSVRLQAIMSMPGVNGTASITVPLNTPPSCPDPPCFSTDTNSTVFPDYTFLGTASGWQDADGDVLMYEFGQVTRAPH